LIVQTNEPEFPSAIRGSQLLSPQCLGSLLGWWFDESDASWPDWLAQNSVAQVVTRTTSGAARITGRDWAAILPADSHDAGLLFRKPEDYWEVNNQADVLPETVEELRRTLRMSEQGSSAP
jgi:hypothetical protein